MVVGNPILSLLAFFSPDCSVAALDLMRGSVVPGNI